MAPTTPIPRLVFYLLAILWFVSPHWATHAYSIAVQDRDETSWSVDFAHDPILRKLLVQNKAWAVKVERQHPGFFNHSAKEQHPNVRVDFSMNEYVFSSLRYAVYSTCG